MAKIKTKTKASGNPVIVEAVGAASKTTGIGISIQNAMATAGLKAMEEGIIDPEVIKQRKMDARKLVKEEASRAAAKANPDAS